MDCYCLEYDKSVSICESCSCGGNKKAHVVTHSTTSKNISTCGYNCSRFPTNLINNGERIRNVRCGTKFELLMSMGLKNE